MRALPCLFWRRGGGEGGFEDGLEEVGGVGARVRDLRRHERGRDELGADVAFA